jgi:hypothetical protein
MAIHQYTSKRTGATSKHVARFGQPGQSDLGGIIRPLGVMLQVEIKRPGHIPSEEQNTWIEFINTNGGIAFYTDSLRSCCDKLRAAFEQRQWPWSPRWEVW